MTNQGLAKVEQPEAGALARAEDLDLGVPVEQLIARVKKIQAVQAQVMQEGLHYGKIPGVDKPSLLKPGAEILGMTFQLAPKFKTVEKYDGDHLEVTVICTLVHIPTSFEVGEGLGSCSTKESKYAYRRGERKCPKCNAAAIIKGKEEYGGGWLCWKKPDKGKNGCGAKFKDGDKSIEDQKADRVANPDLADSYNTVRKMACKRAHVAAILFACGASQLFTQDVEDMQPQDDGARGNGGGDDEDPPQRRPQGNGGQQRRSQNDKPDDNRGQQGGSNGADPVKSNEATTKMLRAFLDSTSAEALEELLPELGLLKEERVLTLDDYRRLREAFGARSRELKGSARQSA